MAKSTGPKRKNKPEKPYPEFPLFLHDSGRWAKKIRGKLHYFGRWGNKAGSRIVPVEDIQASADDALLLYQQQVDDLKAGRKPRGVSTGVTVMEACNRFLTAKSILLNSGELSPRTIADYVRTADTVAAILGKHRVVADLAADDFEELRKRLASQGGVHTLGREIRQVRMIFRYAHEAGLVEHPVRFGPTFKEPSKKAKRKSRQASGERMFEPAELRSIIGQAVHPLKAMILLGANCGFGNTDVASLPIPAVDLERGWINFPRPKTAIPRRCPLWPETIQAIRDAIALGRVAKEPGDADLLFLTKYGQRFVRVRQGFDEAKERDKWAVVDSVSRTFGKLLDSLNLHRPGLNFYTLRHVFETVGGETADQVAVNAIMGHVDNSMAGAYRERIGDDRLQAVVDHVRAWLFPVE